MISKDNKVSKGKRRAVVGQEGIIIMIREEVVKVSVKDKHLVLSKSSNVLHETPLGKKDCSIVTIMLLLV